MLRILHTSDWHLGLELGGHSRLAEQEAFLDWMLETCVRLSADVLLVCGDVFDVLNPPIEAQSLLARFLVAFRQSLPAARAILVSGNHDSASRLEIPGPFGQALGGLHLVGHWRSNEPHRHLLELKDRTGATGAVCLAMPFLRSQDLQVKLLDGESPEAARGRAIAEAYRSLGEAAARAYPGLPRIATGHLTVAGSQAAGSERILIGGVDSVPVDGLREGNAYTALGHIHRCQTAGSPHARYCGSPLAMDFDEADHRHVVLQVDLEPTGTVQVEEIPVPQPVPLLRLGGPERSWQDLSDEVRALELDAWAGLPPNLHPLVELSFREQGPVADLRSRCDALLEGLPLRLVGAPRLHRGESIPTPTAHHGEELDGRDAPLAILRRHWTRQHGVPVPDDIERCFTEVLEQVRAGGDP